MRKRNLVTGGAGFLGSHLIDNYFSGRKSNIIHLIDHPNFELISHDITKPILLEIHRIWHLACPASPIHYQSNPIETTKTSFLGTYNILELAKRVGAKVLLASSSEVYGDPEVHPQREDYKGSVNNIGLRSCYDEGKRISETLCSDFSRVHGVDVRIARIFNTYGPRMNRDDGRVISNFIVQALNKKPLTIYGDGSQTRSFCYVDDLVKGLILLMNSNHKKPLNIGNPDEITIKEVAEIISRQINDSFDFIEKPLPTDDPRKRRPNIELAKDILNWTPKICLKDGIMTTIDYFRKN